MSLALHIFKKDARRLWWEIAVTLGLLAALAQMDSQRADFIPGAWEGLLNLFLPAAWAYLIALAIHEEALAGDRQFWVTRPYPWPALLAAKALFVLVFIHLPCLLADAVILAARGFQPLAHLPLLFWKQLFLACALTLPAAALAALTRNLAQFFLAAAVVVGAVICLAAAVEPLWTPWVPVDEERRGIALAVLFIAATAVILLQYARRWTPLSRTVGIAATLVAGVLFAYTPGEYTFAVRCWLSPAQPVDRQLSISFAPRQEPPAGERLPQFSAQRVRIAVPISVSGVPDAARVRLEQLQLEMVGPHGDRWKATERPRTLQPWKRPLQAFIWPQDQDAAWLMVELDRSVYDRVKEEQVTLTGQAAATFFRAREAVRLPVGAEAAIIPGLGRCLSELRYGSDGPLLKVVCESPSEIPLLSPVRLVRRDSTSEWSQRLGDSTPYAGYPVGTWLSPLHRRQTFFHIRDKVPTTEGSRWLVPGNVLANADIVLAPEQFAGCTIVRYQVRNLKLDQFVVKQEPQ